MTIQVQPTPNPNARKFILADVRFDGSTNFASAADAAELPWVGALFDLEGVYNVFTAQNFVTVNKRATVAWEPLETQVRAVLTQTFSPANPDRPAVDSAQNATSQAN
ncbi:MAG: NifU N-terminal domain-containing protein [Litorilinea sp.]